MKIFEKYKKTIIITVLLCMVPIAFGLIFWDRLPEMMPTHFGINNEANGFMKKPVAVFLIPLMIAAVELVCIIATAVDPKKANIADKSLVVLFWSMPALSWIANGVTYAAALGYKLNIGSIIITFVGFLLLALCNYLPKNSRNFTVGYRTRWALDDEKNWNYTNRVGAICGSIAGLAVAVLGIISFFSTNSALFYILALGAIALGSLVPVLASYLFFRKSSNG